MQEILEAFGTSGLLCRSPIIDPHRKSAGRPHCVVGGCTGYRPGASSVVKSRRIRRCSPNLLIFLAYTRLSAWAVSTRVIVRLISN
jgi:hypothetical protein